MKFVFLICAGFALLLAILFLFLLLQKKYFPEESKSQVEPLVNVSQEDYFRIGEILIACIAANFVQLGLRRPDEPPQHMLPWPNGVRIAKNNQVVFIYCFDRMSDFTLSNGEGQHRYSTVDTATMKRILNGILPNYGIALGLIPLKVVGIKSLENGRVAIAVIPI